MKIIKSFPKYNYLCMSYSNGDESTISISNTSLSTNNGDLKAETPNVKKRHRRMKSSNIKNQECEGM